MTANMGAYHWTVIVPCSASATPTVLCADTFGNRFCQMTRSCKRHWKDSLSASANTVVRNFRQMESEHTAPKSVWRLLVVSKMQPEYGSSEARESNHLTLRNPYGTRVFGGHFAFRREFYQNHENSEEKRYTAGKQDGKLVGGYCLWKMKRKSREIGRAHV